MDYRHLPISAETVRLESEVDQARRDVQLSAVKFLSALRLVRALVGDNPYGDRCFDCDETSCTEDCQS